MARQNHEAWLARRPDVGDAGDADGTEPGVLLHVARRLVAGYVFRTAPEIFDAMEVESHADGLRFDRRRLYAHRTSGGADQYRNTVRVRAGLHRHHDHA